MIRFTCTNCQTMLKAAEGKPGRRVTCPRCKCVVVVPGSGTAPPVVPATAGLADLPEQRKSSVTTIMMVVGALVIGIIGVNVLLCGGFALFTPFRADNEAFLARLAEEDAARKQLLDEAHLLWERGDHRAAVAKYKEQIDSTQVGAHAHPDPNIYQRAIEFEVEHGNTSSAKRLIQVALERKVALAFDDPAPDKLLKQVQAESHKAAQAEQRSPAQGPRGGEGSLQRTTADLLPHKTGATAEYSILIGDITMVKEYHFEENGLIRYRTKSIGGTFVGRWDEAWDRHVLTFDGAVGWMNGDGLFPLHLMIGSGQGDTWVKDGTRYTVESFGSEVLPYDNQPRSTATIRAEMEAGNQAIVIRSVFAKGIGLLRKKGQGPGGTIRWELQVPSRQANLTKAERTFFE